MEKHWPTLCALILTLGALVHLDAVFASDADGSSKGMFAPDSSSLKVKHAYFLNLGEKSACWSVSFTFLMHLSSSWLLFSSDWSKTGSLPSSP